MNAHEKSAAAATARLRFVSAVAELRWRGAAAAVEGMGPVTLAELRSDPALEIAVVDPAAMARRGCLMR